MTTQCAADVADADAAAHASSLAGADPESAESLEFDFGAVCGRPSLWLAPMVGQSEPAFRMLCRKYGATLCTTPMIDPAGYVRSERYGSIVANNRILCGRPHRLTLAAKQNLRFQWISPLTL
jgi:hypothetical protein